MRRYIILAEIHRIQALLLEGRIDVLRDKYRERIADAMEKMHIPLDYEVRLKDEDGSLNPDKMFEIIVSHDPDPTKKNSQWLLNLFVTGRMPVEDVEFATDYLTRYAEKKKRRELAPEQMDLNRFKSLADLYQVIKGAEDKIVSADQAEERAAYSESKIILNTPELLILTPKTEKAGMYFSRGTEWCTGWGDEKGRHPTRTCRFNDYYSQGPIYNITFKATGNKYQFHFPTNQFMNADNRGIDMPELIRQHPEIMRAIGENNFIPYMSQIGISVFSPETLVNARAEELARGIRSEADYKALPAEVRGNSHFVVTLLKDNPRMVAIVPEEDYAPHLVEIVEKATSIAALRLFKTIPDHLKTPKLAKYVALRAQYPSQIKDNIPEAYWTDAIRDHFWKLRIRGDGSLHLVDIPERYRTTEAIVIVLSRFPQDIPDFDDILDQHLVDAIVEKNVKSVKKLPTRFLTAELAERIMHRIYNDYDLMDRFKTEDLPVLIRRGMIKSGSLPFSRWTEEMRSEPMFIDDLLTHNKKAIADIPDSYLTPDILKKHLDVVTIQHVSPALVDDADVLRVIHNIEEESNRINRYARYGQKRVDHIDTLDKLYVGLPKVLKTPAVVAAFAKEGSVPVNDLGAAADSTYVTRLTRKPMEASDLPERLWTAEFFEPLARATIKVFDYLPPQARIEPVLYGFMLGARTGYYYHAERSWDNLNKIIEKFPKEAWSPRVMVAGLKTNILHADDVQVPPDMMTKEVAAMLVARAPARLKDVPSRLVDNEMLVDAVQHGHIDLVKALTPEQVTEPVAHAIMLKFAKDDPAFNINHVAYQPGKPIYDHWRTALRDVPRENWSLRVYEQAAGRVVDLKDVPVKFRKKPVVAAAIARDPSCLTSLKDPAGWLNANGAEVDAVAGEKRLSDKKWRLMAEANGVIFVKQKGFINVKDLAREDLKHGSIAVVRGGVNLRAYLFDKKGRFVARLYEDKGKIKMPEWKLAEAHRNLVAEAATKVMGNYEVGDLVNLRIRTEGSRPKTFKLEETAERKTEGGLEYAVNKFDRGEVLTIWKKNRQVMRVHATRSSRSWNWVIDKVELVDPLALIEAGDNFKTIYTRNGLAYDWDLYAAGLVPFGSSSWGRHSRGDVEFLPEKKLGEVADLSVWVDRNAKRISIVGPKGMMAHATILKSGKLSKHHISYHFKDLEEAIMAAFREFEQKLMAARSGKK